MSSISVQTDINTAEQVIPAEKQEQRVAIYCRSATGDIDYLIKQERELIAYATHILDIPTYELYVDSRASGKGFKHRQMFSKMMEEMLHHKFTHLLIYDISRLSRSTSEAVRLIDKFSDLDVTVISKKENLNTKTPAGHFFVSLMADLEKMEHDLNVLSAEMEAQNSRTTASTES